jgi:hypothetical protein
LAKRKLNYVECVMKGLNSFQDQSFEGRQIRLMIPWLVLVEESQKGLHVVKHVVKIEKLSTIPVSLSVPSLVLDWKKPNDSSLPSIELAGSQMKQPHFVEYVIMQKCSLIPPVDLVQKMRMKKISEFGLPSDPIRQRLLDESDLSMLIRILLVISILMLGRLLLERIHRHWEEVGIIGEGEILSEGRLKGIYRVLMVLLKLGMLGLWKYPISLDWNLPILEWMGISYLLPVDGGRGLKRIFRKERIQSKMENEEKSQKTNSNLSHIPRRHNGQHT